MGDIAPTIKTEATAIATGVAPGSIQVDGIHSLICGHFGHLVPTPTMVEQGAVNRRTTKWGIRDIDTLIHHELKFGDCLFVVQRVEDKLCLKKIHRLLYFLCKFSYVNDLIINL